MARAASKSTAMQVIRRLRSADFQALLAGGCVRDMLLGRRSSDYDVATDATPQQVKRLFRHVLLIGAKFGVAMVIVGGRKVEVTTFRTDLPYADGRRPEGVVFSSPAEDAKRRDFTINGMFYDPIAEQVIDYVGGQADLARGVIRTIGDPNERFGEDYLRMIRAVRFAVHLGFQIDAKTAAAARRHAKKVRSISGERIFDELSKMLCESTADQSLRKMHELGLAQTIVPELFDAGLWDKAVERVACVTGGRDMVLAMAALLIDLPRGVIGKIIRRWGASNELRNGLCWMARRRRQWRAAADVELCQFKRLMAGEHFARLRKLWTFDERGETGRIVQARRIARRAGRIDPTRVHPPSLVTGDDLLGMGQAQGAELGRILRRLYDEQLNEQLTTRRQALAKARKLVVGGRN